MKVWSSEELRMQLDLRDSAFEMDSSTTLPLVAISIPLVLAMAQNVQNGELGPRRDARDGEAVVEGERREPEARVYEDVDTRTHEMAGPETPLHGSCESAVESEASQEGLLFRQTTLDDWLLRNRQARCSEEDKDLGLLGLGVLPSPSPSPAHTRPTRFETICSVSRIPDEPLHAVGGLGASGLPFRQQAISSSTLRTNETSPASSNENHDTTIPWPRSERLGRYRFILPSNDDFLLRSEDAHPILLPQELIFARVRWCDNRAVEDHISSRSSPSSTGNRWYSFYTPDIPFEDLCRSLTKDGEFIDWIEHGDRYPQKVDESDWLQQVGAFDTGREVSSFVWHVCEEGDGVHCADEEDEMEE